ncbi:hypothetical protein GPJ56_002967 [Histomonas meleagridis]|uniref:uncharacterized protein n=1 Tax=Histomonas meleagridis TaxID=135588 RepID=UPI003559DBBB|nr:hypothetical protein GPJ56_002967 [Histomonas meleagridis]KAH0796626.1 hypothetical protein GO595_010519 [Histomonas meleagridis]
MEPTDIAQLLINVVESRILSLETEILLFDEQISLVAAAPGIKSNDRIQLTLQRNIKATLHTLLKYYCKRMRKLCTSSVPFQQAISFHLFVLQRNKFKILLQELYGQQSALTTLVGADYQRYTNDNDVPADIHLKMIALVFPYEFVVDLLSSSDFMRSLIKTALKYECRHHVQSISVIFNLIRRFKTLDSLSHNVHFFTAKNPMYFTLAEHFVCVFVRNKMFQSDWAPLRNFSTAEKCALITISGTSTCGLSPKLIDKLKAAAREKTIVDDDLYLRPYERTIEITTSEEMEIPELKHIILELRKMQVQPTPSAMLYILSNALQWLNSALTSDGNLIGADETFQFFVYCLALSKLWCLPGIVSFIDHFVDDALRETKFEYYIEQLRSGLEFIDNRLLPVQPFIVFPFITLNNRLREIIQPIDNGKLTLKGFALYAFPSWNSCSEELFPAMIRYEGSNEVVKCYKYHVKDVAKLVPNSKFKFETIPTLQGSFLQLTDKILDEQCMIKIESGDYEKEIGRINTISCLLLFNPTLIQRPSLDMINKLYFKNRKFWNMKSDDPLTGVQSLIIEVQKALVKCGFNDLEVNGILNRKTANAIRHFFGADSKRLVLTPKLFKILIETSKKHQIK